MTASKDKSAANRTNAKRSAGPKTCAGKAIVSKNATRHAILSERMIVDGEDPDELEQLRNELNAALAPVGIVEHTLVERICVSIWRQRRLVRAETAALALAAQPRRIAGDVSRELDLGLANRLSEDELVPLDLTHVQWCETVIEEYEQLESIRDHIVFRQSFLTISRIEAHRRNASAFLSRHSQSLASRRQRLSQPMVRSTIQRLGRTTNLRASDRLTISRLTWRQTRFNPCWNLGP